MDKLTINRPYRYVKRHLITPLRENNSLKKLTNLNRALFSLIMRRKKIESYPIIAKFEVASFCNLRCPGCVHGQQPFNEVFKSHMRMSFSTFKLAIDSFGSFLYKAILHHVGEPFLNKDIFQMCEYAKQHNINTCVSSNFNFHFTNYDIERIIELGPSHLIISIDGTTQEMYKKYRKGGSLNLVLENIRKLVNTRKKFKIDHPFLEIQFIVFDHNCHILKEAYNLALTFGVDRFSLKYDSVIKNNTYMGAPSRGEPENRKHFGGVIPPCIWPWLFTVIKRDGSVVPCCFYDWTKATAGFGNLTNKSFPDNIWNSKQYQLCRNVISSPSAHREKGSNTWCGHCNRIIY